MAKKKRRTGNLSKTKKYYHFYEKSNTPYNNKKKKNSLTHVLQIEVFLYKKSYSKHTTNYRTTTPAEITYTVLVPLIKNS